jgi:hypothetical protein
LEGVRQSGGSGRARKRIPRGGLQKQKAERHIWLALGFLLAINT